MDDKPPPRDVTLHPAYRSAANAITKPTSLLISRYLVEKWLPELGGDGLAILSFLRKKCYYNVETGEKRDQIRCKMAEIGKGCRVSASTVRRQLRENKALAQFITVAPEYDVDPKRQGLYQTENSYHVLMDDPVHPSDYARLQEEIQKIELRLEKGTDDPKERARMRRAQAFATPSQNDTALSPPVPQRPLILEGGPPKLEAPASHPDRPAFQNGNAYTGFLSSSNSMNPESSPAAPGDSLSLFEDGTEGEGIAPGAEEIQEVRAALRAPEPPRRAVKLKEVEAEWGAMPPGGKERFRAEALCQLQEQGQAEPPERMVEPLMFKLFWVERKGLVPSKEGRESRGTLGGR